MTWRRFKIWDILSFVLITTVLAVVIYQPFFIHAIFEDITYHLLVAQNFHRAGGITTTDFWESLPEGRPHNYPPLFHILISLLLNFTDNYPLVIDLVSGGSIILSLFLSWLGLRLLISPQVAFFALLIFSNFANYIIFLGVVGPASLVLASIPLLLYLFEKRKTVGATILLAMMFYTHMLIPWLIVVCLLLWSFLYKRKDLWYIVRTVSFALVLYSPWLINILNDLDYVKYVNDVYVSNPKEHLTAAFTVNVLVTVLAIISLFYIWVDDEAPKEKSHWRFFLILAALQIPILYSDFPSRFTSSGGYFALAIILATALSHFVSKYDRKQQITIVVGVIMISQIGSVEMFCQETVGGPSCRMGPMPGLIYQAKLLSDQNPETRNLISRYDAYTNKNLELARAIKEWTEPDDVILNLSDNFNLMSYNDRNAYAVAQFFGALSNRGIANPRAPESFWKKDVPRPEDVRIVLADYHDTNLFPKPRNRELAEILEKNFLLIGRSERLGAFKNLKSQTIKITPADPKLPLWLAEILVLLAAGMVGFYVFKAHTENQNN